MGNTSDILINTAVKDAFWVQISGTEHASFSAYALWLTANTLEYRREATRTIHACAPSFLNRQLKGQDDGLLTQGSPASKYPRIMGFRRR